MCRTKRVDLSSTVCIHIMIRTNKLLLKGCLLTVFLFVLSSCSQDITLGTRSMTDSLPVVTIPGAPIPAVLNLSLDLAIDSEILGIEADSRFLTFARLRGLRLDIQDSSDTDDVEDGAQDNFDCLSVLTALTRATFDGRHPFDTLTSSITKCVCNIKPDLKFVAAITQAKLIVVF